jgi:iron complex outermembrane receptor protein
MITIRHAVGAAVCAVSRRSHRSNWVSWLGVLGAVTYAAGLMGLSSPVVAQEAPAASSSAGGTVSLEEVTVTGSRIKRTTDFNTPTPTTVIDSATMEALGIVNVGEALTMSPANASTFTPANTGNANFFTGSYIADLRGLNPYFGSRTLTLVNGRRMVQTDQGDSVDLNFIPQILVDRVDTVTGGASAAYGSGAIAGVVNVIMDTKLEGGKVNADFYQTSHSDARDYHVGAAYGHGFLDNQLHIVVGGEYENQNALGCQNVRTWCAQDNGLYESSVSSHSVAAYTFGSGLRLNQISQTGVFTAPGPNPVANTPLGLQATADGTGLMPYYSGQIPYAGDAASNSVIGGSGEPINQYTNLLAPVNRGVLSGTMTWALTDTINLTADADWGKVQTQNVTGALSDTGDTLSNQNAFLNPTMDAALFPTGVNTVGYNKDWTSQVNSLTRFTTDVTRFSFGFDGKFGGSSWTWDAYYEYGVTEREQLVQDNRKLLSYYMALDSVVGPNGQPECRVTANGGNPAAAVGQALASTGFQYFPLYGLALASPTIGLLAQNCVPIDPFGNQPLSSAAYAYSFGNLDERLRYEQTVAAANVSGNYFKGIGAGPFAAAFGFEWRQEVGHNNENPCSPGQSAALCEAENDDYLIQYGEPFGGKVTVYEGYAETNLPLIKDMPGAHLLELDVAGRFSRYENQALYGIDVTPGVTPPTFDHNLTTWKVSGIYEAVDGVRLRASQSRDARAANFRELYYGQIFTPGGFFGYCNGDFGDPCHWNLEGNTNLAPETSNTTTVGLVLTPKDVVPGLQFSADWFHIKITNAIEQANIQAVWTGCRAGVQADCNNMLFNSTAYDANPASPGFNKPCPCGTDPTYTGQAAWQGGVDNGTSTTAQSYNGAFYEVRGVDFSFNYLMDLGSFGSVNTRLLTTWMGEQEFQGISTAPVYNILGQTGTGNNFLNDYQPTAKWRGSLLVTWANGPLSITPSMNFVGHGIQDYVGVTPAQAALYNEVYNGAPAILGYGYHLLPGNDVPSYFLFNLNGTYTVPNVSALKGLQLFVQINNLFNKTPPITYGGGGFGPNSGIGGTNPIFFDTLGLAYRVGFRMTF